MISQRVPSLTQTAVQAPAITWGAPVGVRCGIRYVQVMTAASGARTSDVHIPPLPVRVLHVHAGGFPEPPDHRLKAVARRRDLPVRCRNDRTDLRIETHQAVDHALPAGEVVRRRYQARKGVRDSVLLGAGECRPVHGHSAGPAPHQHSRTHGRRAEPGRTPRQQILTMARCMLKSHVYTAHCNRVMAAQGARRGSVGWRTTCPIGRTQRSFALLPSPP